MSGPFTTVGGVVDDIFVQMGVNKLVADELRGAARAARAGEIGSAMTHAWLFTGPPGSGRSVAARAFAAALECDNPEIVGCGECEQCVKVRRGAHGDVLTIVPRELVISVKTVRDEVVVPAAKKPTVAKWRIVILDNADRLNDASGNSLLKTLEEPPAHTVIMLCAPSTDPDDVIPTLVSRSRHVYVPQPSVDDVVHILTRRDSNLDENVARMAAAATGNHVGRARRLVYDEEARKRRASILHLAELISHGDQAFLAVTDIVKKVTKGAEQDLAEENEKELEKLKNALGMGTKGKGVHKALRGAASSIKELEDLQKKRKTRAIRDALDLCLTDLAGLYRDALILSSGADVSSVHTDFAGLAKDLSKIGEPGLVACIDAIMTCRDHIAVNVRPETAMDAMVGKIRKASGVS